MRVKNNILKSNDGFSLVQVVIAAGLMGLVAMFMLRMQENQRLSQNKMNFDAELNQLMNKLTSTFIQSDICLKNLEGFNVGKEIELTEVVAPNDRKIFEVGELYGNRTLLLERISKKKFFYNNDEKTYGDLSLNVTVRSNKKIFGNQTMTKSFDVIVYVDENEVITGCSAPGGLGAGAVNNSNISTEDVATAVTISEEEKEIMNEEDLKKIEDVQKTIESNPALKQFQNAIEQLQKSNEEMEQLHND